jgi:dipeptidyl aminopeptidase/acylaminoacyl peptidase
MSVLECVTAATKAVIATGMVDAKRIGLIGHSWGGFGTAFVLTQTDMFAAGAAGRPADESGFELRRDLLEHWRARKRVTAEVGQERMEVPLWEDPGAYIRNSAVFSVNKMRISAAALRGR